MMLGDMAAAVGDSIGGKLAPPGLGLITLFFGIGQSLGPAVAGWLKDLTGTFAWAFILSAAVSLLGAAGSILLRKKIWNSKIIQGQHGFMLIALYMVFRLQLQ